MDKKPARIDKILAKMDKTADPAVMMDLVEDIRRDGSNEVSNLIEQGKYADAAEESAKIEMAYQKAINRVRERSDLGSLLASLQEAASYWKERSERLRIDALQAEEKEHWDKGLSFSAEGQYTEALESLDEALKVNLPDNKHAILIDKGNVYYRQRDFKQAMSIYEQALVLNPHSIAALGNKGLALLNLANYTEAIIYFDHVLKIDKNNVNALINKGSSLANLKEYDEAIKCLERATMVDPQNSLALYIRGRTLSTRGFTFGKQGDEQSAKNDYRNAIKFYERALSILPNDISTIREMGRTYHNLEENDEAMKYLTRLDELDPNDFDAALIKGAIAIETGKFHEAVEYYSRAAKLNPDDVETEMSMAEALLLSGEYSKSEEMARKPLAKTTNPVHVYIIRHLIVCSLYLRDIQAANEEAIDLINYYKSFPADYDLNWDFTYLRKFIRESRLSENKKQLLNLLTVAIEEKKEATQVIDRLRYLIRQESLVNKAIDLFKAIKPTSKADIDFSTVNTASPIPQKAGWYDWEIHFNEPQERLAKIKSVTYVLHPTFSNPERTVDNKKDGFQLKGRGWGSFRVKIIIKLENGESVTKYHWLDLSLPHK